MKKQIKWVPTDHPINQPHKSENIEQSFKEEQIQRIEQVTDPEQDDWFLDQILNHQPDFWWVY